VLLPVAMKGIWCYRNKFSCKLISLMIHRKVSETTA